ncbi:serine/threonine-protein kinase [Aquisphaera insulae]|uniref:serine/threonine-protein kinase n=1 Tax=Aquisphaera insulae TaxID=2712864 RepID=UPI0013EDCCE0|nr:serine/threonine-protein kinase [Aquisphaera insulae]
MPESDPPSSELTRHQYGSYRVLHPLGSGGMSSVYRAVHEDTGHVVALKVLPPDLARNSIALQRFLREARSAERLEHPAIVSIYDRGLDRGRNYIVLEYIDGSDLHAFVQVHGPLAVREAVRTLRVVAEGLQFAAVRGLIHRDIKPSNILRSESGEIKITDLGLALQADKEDERVTREGTTVGTVDYMAPEQARDSRAASERSDMYSLGCTCYYLLAGIPPFPGGDITDKLTRHARSAPPDVRDLRPDVPVEFSRLIQKLMAKRPEDRFATFEDLIEALDGLPLPAEDGGPDVSLVPIGEDAVASNGDGRPRIPVVALGEADRPPSSLPEISLASLPDDEIASLVRPIRGLPLGGGGAGVAALPAPLPRLPAPIEPAPLPGEERRPLALGAWIALFTSIGVAFILAVILIDRLVRVAPESIPSADRRFNPDEDAALAAPPLPNHPLPGPESVAARPPAPAPRADVRAPVRPSVTRDAWAEPEDVEVSPRREPIPDEILRAYLPEWALSPVPSRLEGPVTVVRRVPGSRDPSVVATLRAGLEKTRGTTEIADEGPFLLVAPLSSSEHRMLRARPGYRPVVRVEQSVLPAARQLPALLSIESRGLVLDSLDIVVNLRDAPPPQVALFRCTDASLTIRNCTITLFNPRNVPFTLFAADGDPSKGTRIRIEGSLFRGPYTSAFTLGKGSIDVAVRDSMLIGAQGPLIRDLDRSAGHRVSIVASVLGSRGPSAAIEGELPAGGGRPLSIRAYRTVFGRFQGAGIASVIAAGSPMGATQAVAWTGDRNLYVGWKGFFAQGAEATVIVNGLEGVRSTWNGAGRESREILAAWPDLESPTSAVPSNLSPFVPGFETLLDGPAIARPYLEAKTLSTFAEPLIPMPAVVAREVAIPPGGAPRQGSSGKLPLLQRQPDAVQDLAGIGAPAGDGDDLHLDAADPRWHGDLGLFLRESIGPERKRARVRVTGSGLVRCSPVVLPDGVRLEIRVDAPASPDAPWLAWQPDPATHGKALIELKGGALVLSQLRFQTEPAASLESIIHVEDGHLILHRCQVVTPPRADAGVRRLVTFRAATTRPGVGPSATGLFVQEPDRPTCVIADSTLISGSSAIRLELGRGQVAIAGTAIAAATDAIELNPSRVARDRFAADLVLDRCTISSESNIVRLGAWPGSNPGPDRPWLITSHFNAFLGSYDRRVSDTSLLRADEVAMAGGALFWQARGDALDVDCFTAAGTETPSLGIRDVGFQWVSLWGGNHIAQVTGPRAGSNRPSSRLLERLKPGRVDPAGLILDASYHPDRLHFDFGADLGRQGIHARPAGTARRY